VPTGWLHHGSACYCVGCGENISFDLALIEQFGCEVYAFDPTPRSIEYVTVTAANVPGFHFFGLGIWHCEGTVKFYQPKDPGHVSHSIVNIQGTTDHIEVPTRRLKSVLQDNGHSQIDLLKLDIEGAEIAVLKSILEDRLRIGVLCVEYDGLGFPTPGRIAEIRSSVAAILQSGYRLFWLDGYNFTFVSDDGARRTR
jgi:FkbM family methyltransferase